MFVIREIISQFITRSHIIIIRKNLQHIKEIACITRIEELLKYLYMKLYRKILFEQINL